MFSEEFEKIKVAGIGYFTLRERSVVVVQKKDW
jgi:hypothetical protein